MALKEGGNGAVVAEAEAVVERRGFDLVVVDGDPAVRVPDADVEGEGVVEGGVGEIERGELGVFDGDFEFAGAEDEPEDEEEDAEGDDDGEDEFEEGAEEAAAGVAAAAVGAPADAPVGSGGRRDGGAVEGAGEAAGGFGGGSH